MSPARVIIGVAAVVLPGVLVAVVLGAFSSVPTGVGPSSEAAVLDGRLKGPPDVVLLGNSKIAADLDAAALAVAWAPEGGAVVPLGVNGTGAPVWYAVLQQRVYAAEYEPKLVIVYATLAMMVQTSLPSEGQRATLAAQMPEADPVLTQKVFGGERNDPRWQRVLNRRTTFHGALMDDLRDAAGRLVGAVDAAGALARVFANDQMATTERARAVPVAEVRGDGADRAAVRAEDTLLVDMVESAQAHGAQVLVVRAPLGSMKRANDVVDPGLERGVVEWLGAHGAGYLDLRRAGPTDADFGDGAHLTQLGKNRFTPVLLRRLREEGYGAGRNIRPAVLKVERPRPLVERVGELPALPPLKAVRGPFACDWQSWLPGFGAISDTNLQDAGWGQVSPFRVWEDDHLLRPHDPGPGVADRCGGASVHFKGVVKYSPTDDPSAEGHAYTLQLDPSLPVVSPTWDEAWWIYPGTSLRFTIPAGVLAGPAGVAVRLEAPPIPWYATPDPLAEVVDPWVSVNGGPRSPLRPLGAGWEAVVPPVEQPDSWTVEVGATSGWLDIRRLAVGTEADPWLVIGEPPEPITVNVLAGAPTFPREPRRLYGPLQRPTPAPWKEGVWVLPVEFMGVPSMEEVSSITGSGCSPLRLALDGQPATAPADAPDGPAPARAVHSEGRMLLSLVEPVPADAISLPEGPKRFSLFLEPTRVCVRESRWLYPGDEVVFHLAGPALERLRAAATSLDVTASALRSVEGEYLGAEVLVDGQSVGTARSALGELSGLGLTVPLPGGVPRTATAVDVRLWVASDRVPLEKMEGYVLLTHVMLTEPGVGVFAAE